MAYLKVPNYSKFITDIFNIEQLTTSPDFRMKHPFFKEQIYY